MFAILAFVLSFHRLPVLVLDLFAVSERLAVLDHPYQTDGEDRLGAGQYEEENLADNQVL